MRRSEETKARILLAHTYGPFPQTRPFSERRPVSLSEALDEYD